MLGRNWENPVFKLREDSDEAWSDKRSDENSKIAYKIFALSSVHISITYSEEIQKRHSFYPLQCINSQ